MRHKPGLPKSHILYTIAVIGFIYTLHLVLPMYSSSSFLSLFGSPQTVGIIFMLGSAVTILGFLFVPFLIRKIGNYSVCLWLLLLQVGFIYGLTVTNDPRLIALYFILQTAAVALIGFCLDIFLEVYSTNENVGAIRGAYMTTMNSAWIVAPLIGSMMIGASYDYRNVYVASLFILIPLFYLIYKNFPRFKDPHYAHPSLFQTLAHLFKNKNHCKLFLVNIVLQTFYAWMVVYSPIYLNTVIGLSWAEIGIILTIMLVPFVLLQWPLGRLADKKYGEKEIMVIGLAILGIATIALASIVSHNVFVWALALFMTRVGAASVEVMIETYFFKTVNIKDPNMLGFFRVTRSVSYFIAPLITGIVFMFTMDQAWLFVTVGVLCVLAIVPAVMLKDTR